MLGCLNLQAVTSIKPNLSLIDSWNLSAFCGSEHLVVRLPYIFLTSELDYLTTSKKVVF